MRCSTLFLLIIVTFFSLGMRAATFTIENYFDEEMVIIFSTNKIFGKTNINVEMPRGMFRYKVDTGVYKITGIDILIGSRSTGRESYKIIPRITLDNPLIINGSLRFFRNQLGEMWCEFKFGNRRGQGILVKF